MLRTLMGEHSGDLGLEVFAKLSLLGEGEEFVIRWTRPEEVGETGGERVIIEGDNFFWVVGTGLDFGAEEETGRCEKGGKGLSDAVLE